MPAARVTVATVSIAPGIYDTISARNSKCSSYAAPAANNAVTTMAMKNTITLLRP